MRPLIKIGLLIALVAVLGGISTGVYLFYKGEKDITSAKADYSVTANDLLKEFEADEASASSKYINKIVEVTGTVLSVTKAEGEKSGISLKTGNEMSSVICTFSKEIPSRPREGDEITVRGECSGYLMDVLLNNCMVVK